MSKGLFNTIDDVYRKIYKHQNFIPLHEPSFFGNEKKYVNDCIDSTFVSTVGRYVDEFQSSIKTYSGSRYAVATVNGTAALHLALVSCGVGKGDEVICPDISFVATAAAIVYTGADPVFLDIDEETLGLSHIEVEKFILENTYEKDGKRFNKQSNKIVKACMPMHNVGFPVKINKIKQICDEYNIVVIEDAAESLGSFVDKKMCGTFGKVGVYSFNGNKTITTGGGGMLVTDDEGIYKKALHLSTTAKISHPYMYEHDEIGYNYRMPNINAALGVAQVEQIDEILKIKKAQFDYIKRSINDENIEVIDSKYGISNYWFIVCRLENIDIDYFINEMTRKKIMSRPLWSRISQMKPYKNFLATKNEVSQKITEQYICLPNGVAINGE